MSSRPRLWSESMQQLKSPAIMIASFREILTGQFEILYLMLSRLVFGGEYTQQRDALQIAGSNPGIAYIFQMLYRKLYENSPLLRKNLPLDRKLS